MKGMTKRDQRSISAAFADFARLWRNQRAIARDRMRVFPWLLTDKDIPCMYSIAKHRPHSPKVTLDKMRIC